MFYAQSTSILAYSLSRSLARSSSNDNGPVVSIREVGVMFPAHVCPVSNPGPSPLARSIMPRIGVDLPSPPTPAPHYQPIIFLSYTKREGTHSELPGFVNSGQRTALFRKLRTFFPAKIVDNARALWGFHMYWVTLLTN